jgi:uncharacterized protein YeaO (DUF488 family)
MPARIRIKRAYEPPAAADGTRVLVDRLWPRGLTKASAAISLWRKDVAPTAALRRWFGHDPARWDEFRRRYETELRAKTESLAELKQLAKSAPLTLIYAARDPAHNHALVLRDVILRRRRPG